MSFGIGATLREARESQGRSLEEVAGRLRARVGQLDALEAERFGDFGGEVYAKGFLRSYAVELGLDPEPLLELFRREVGGADENAMSLTVSVGTPRQQRAAPAPWMAWLLIAVVVVAGVSLLGTLDGGRAPDQASSDELDGPPPPPAANDRDTDDAQADPGAGGGTEQPPVEEPEPEPVLEPEGVDLLLALEANSWLRVIVDGSLVLEQTVEAGQTLPFVGEQEIEVRFGNAGGVRANLNGEDLGAQGASGQAITVRYTPEGLERT